MFPTGFIQVCSLGSEKLFSGVLTQIKNFFLKKDSNHFNKKSKKIIFYGGTKQRVNKVIFLLNYIKRTKCVLMFVRHFYFATVKFSLLLLYEPPSETHS